MVKTLCITCEVEGDASAETSSHFGHFERPHSMEQWATEVCELTLSTRHEGCFLLRPCALCTPNFCAAPLKVLMFGLSKCSIVSKCPNNYNIHFTCKYLNIDKVYNIG